MEASGRVGLNFLNGRVDTLESGLRWPRVLALAAAAAFVAYVAVVALPRYASSLDLHREIAALTARAEAVGGDMPLVPPTKMAGAADRDRSIEPADLLPNLTGAGRRSGLQVVAVKQTLPPPAASGMRRIRLNASASFEQVVVFLDEVSSISTKLRIETLSLVRPPGSTPAAVKLDVECALSLELPEPAAVAAGKDKK